MVDTDLAPSVSDEEAAIAAAFDAEIDALESTPTVAKREEVVHQENPPEDSERDYEAEARDMGWRPKEEWNGDPEKHRDAKTFVELADNDPSILRKKYADLQKQHEETVRGLTQATKAQVERERKAAEEKHQQHIDSLKAERDNLIRQYAGDADAIKTINNSYEEAVQRAPTPTPQAALEWKAANPAFESDPFFNASAIAGLDVVSKDMPNADLKTQLAELDKRLSKRFPEYYKSTSVEPSEKTPDAPPAGSRQLTGIPKSKPSGEQQFSNLPAEAKALYRELSEEMDISKEQFLKDYHNG